MKNTCFKYELPKIFKGICLHNHKIILPNLESRNNVPTYFLFNILYFFRQIGEESNEEFKSSDPKSPLSVSLATGKLWGPILGNVEIWQSVTYPEMETEFSTILLGFL